MKVALDALGPAPISPVQPLLTCSEPTFEGLCKLFGSGQPSLGLFSTEGGQFIGGHGMNQDNKLKTAAGLEVADILLGDSLLAGQGLLSRMLVTAPDTTIGSRLWRNEQQRTTVI